MDFGNYIFHAIKRERERGREGRERERESKGRASGPSLEV